MLCTLGTVSMIYMMVNKQKITTQKVAAEGFLRRETERKTGGQGLSGKIPGGVARGYIEDILTGKRSHSCVAARRSRTGEF